MNKMCWYEQTGDEGYRVLLDGKSYIFEQQHFVGNDIIDEEF